MRATILTLVLASVLMMGAAPQDAVPTQLVDNPDPIAFEYTFHGVRLDCQSRDDGFVCMHPWDRDLPVLRIHDENAPLSTILEEPGAVVFRKWGAPLGCDNDPVDCATRVREACRLVGEKVDTVTYSSVSISHCSGKCTGGTTVECVQPDPPERN